MRERVQPFSEWVGNKTTPSNERESTASEKGKIDIAKLKQEEYYNESPYMLQLLSVGETVRVKTPTRPWEKGTIIGTNRETRSCKVKTEAISDYTRNRKHSRKSIEAPVPYDNPGMSYDNPAMSYDNPDMSYDNPDCKSNDIKGSSPEPNTRKDTKTIITRSVLELKPPAKYNNFVKSCL